MRVYITHGFEAYPTKHWFVWLKENLANSGVEVIIPHLPNATNPNVDEWIGTLEREAGEIDEGTYFIGHSLGCITTLRFLSQVQAKIGGIILISGFDKGLNLLPNLDNFTNVKLDYQKLIAMTPNRLVISARDDNIVPTNLSQILAQNLEATFLQTSTGNHFMQDDGFCTFPLLLNELKFLMKIN